MKVSACIGCGALMCRDVEFSAYHIPEVELDPVGVTVAMISEAAPDSLADYFYSGPGSLFAQTTVQAFIDAGSPVSSVEDILGLGVYLTTAVKCAKTRYGIESATVVECSRLLEQELALFPNLKALMLMGDAAIKALNSIARRNSEPRVIPAVSTYKAAGPGVWWS
jgi:hypothetical protein